MTREKAEDGGDHGTGMVAVERISFRTSGHEADERLLREYLVPEMDRLESIEGCTGVRFARFGQVPQYDASEVRLGIYGDYEAVIDVERERWDELVEEGLIESWEQIGAPFADQSEAVQATLRDAYLLGSRMATEYVESFEDRPGLVAETTDEAGRRYGLWTALHVFANNAGYSASAEVDAYELLLRDRLVALTELRGHEFVRERIEELRGELDELEATVDELDEQGGFEYYEGPERDEGEETSDSTE